MSDAYNFLGAPSNMMNTPAPGQVPAPSIGQTPPELAQIIEALQQGGPPNAGPDVQPTDPSSLQGSLGNQAQQPGVNAVQNMMGLNTPLGQPNQAAQQGPLGSPNDMYSLLNQPPPMTPPPPGLY